MKLFISRLFVLAAGFVFSSICFGFVQYGPIKKGESLWAIANHHTLKGVSTHEMIKAIEQLNPHAFANDHLDSLKVGAQLYLPVSHSELEQALKGTVSSNDLEHAQLEKPTMIQASSPLLSPSSPKPARVESPKILKKQVTEEIREQKTAQLQAEKTELMVKSLKESLQASKMQTAALENQLSLSQQEIQKLTEKLQSNSSRQALPVSQEVNHSSSGFWAWLWFILLFASWVYCGYKERWFDSKILTYFKRNKTVEDELCMGDYAQLDQPDLHPTHQFDHAKIDKVQLHHGEVFAKVAVAIAEQQFDRAERMLLDAIKKDSQCIALRLRLLELYTKANNQTAFDRHSQKLLTDKLVKEGDVHWQKIRKMYVHTWVYDK